MEKISADYVQITNLDFSTCTNRDVCSSDLKQAAISILFYLFVQTYFRKTLFLCIQYGVSMIFTR